MNQRERNALDRHITGNWGEDSVPDDEYEGDYACHDTEDFGRHVATRVYREPFTPAGFRVLTCEEHAPAGYSRDLEAEEELEANKARENQ